jgi:hypothetical protein
LLVSGSLGRFGGPPPDTNRSPSKKSFKASGQRDRFDTYSCTSAAETHTSLQFLH